MKKGLKCSNFVAKSSVRLIKQSDDLIAFYDVRFLWIREPFFFHFSPRGLVLFIITTPLYFQYLMPSLAYSLKGNRDKGREKQTHADPGTAAAFHVFFLVGTSGNFTVVFVPQVNIVLQLNLL